MMGNAALHQMKLLKNMKGVYNYKPSHHQQIKNWRSSYRSYYKFIHSSKIGYDKEYERKIYQTYYPI